MEKEIYDLVMFAHANFLITKAHRQHLRRPQRHKLGKSTLNFKPSLNKACASCRFTSSSCFCPASLPLSTFTDTLSFLPGRILLMSSLR